MAEHFVQPPHWEWYIIGYFFLAGLAGGSYTIATMLRLWGSPRDEGVARIGFLIAFPLVVVCAIFLTVDLGRPERFWHMLVNTTPGETGLILKYWSPISVGSYVLSVFGLFSFVSFVEALALERRARVPGGERVVQALAGRAGLIVNVIGSLAGLFLASYTGVVLSVSNEPVWSDTWAIGGLFVASALSGSAALLSLLSHYRADAEWTDRRLQQADAYFAVLELLLIAVFFFTLIPAGTSAKALAAPWGLLWLLVVASLVVPLVGFAGRRVRIASTAGTVTTASIAAGSSVVASAVVLAGVFLLRCVVILSAQS
jgi:formate-dependent nitrite reductase membrane component NrfD